MRETFVTEQLFWEGIIMGDFHRYVKAESEQIEMKSKAHSKFDEQHQEARRGEKSDPSQHIHHLWRRF
jgi:hypothetical protein